MKIFGTKQILIFGGGKNFSINESLSLLQRMESQFDSGFIIQKSNGSLLFQPFKMVLYSPKQKGIKCYIKKVKNIIQEAKKILDTKHVTTSL